MSKDYRYWVAVSNDIFSRTEIMASDFEDAIERYLDYPSDLYSGYLDAEFSVTKVSSGEIRKFKVTKIVKIQPMEGDEK